MRVVNAHTGKKYNVAIELDHRPRTFRHVYWVYVRTYVTLCISVAATARYDFESLTDVCKRNETPSRRRAATIALRRSDSARRQSHWHLLALVYLFYIVLLVAHARTQPNSRHYNFLMDILSLLNRYSIAYICLLIRIFFFLIYSTRIRSNNDFPFFTHIITICIVQLYKYIFTCADCLFTVWCVTCGQKGQIMSSAYTQHICTLNGRIFEHHFATKSRQVYENIHGNKSITRFWKIIFLILANTIFIPFEQILLI